jgi:hypothetical protein
MMAEDIVGFHVTLSSPDGTGASTDTEWESWGGGGVSFEDCNDVLADRFQTTSPGHKSVGEITLRGAMTDKRAALCTWINETVNGKPWKKTLTITELLSVDGGVKDGKQYVYSDCFPCRYVFPRLSLTNTTGNVQEELRIRAGSMTVREAPPPR